MVGDLCGFAGDRLDCVGWRTIGHKWRTSASGSLGGHCGHGDSGRDLCERTGCTIRMERDVRLNGCACD